MCQACLQNDIHHQASPVNCDFESKCRQSWSCDPTLYIPLSSPYLQDVLLPWLDKPLTQMRKASDDLHAHTTHKLCNLESSCHYRQQICPFGMSDEPDTIYTRSTVSHQLTPYQPVQFPGSDWGDGESKMLGPMMAVLWCTASWIESVCALTSALVLAMQGRGGDLQVHNNSWIYQAYPEDWYKGK